MKRIILTLGLAIYCLMVSAQYKVDKLDGKSYMAGACIVENADDEALFANLVLWVQQMANAPGMGMFSVLDYAKHHVELKTSVKGKSASYTGMLKMDVYGGIIKFRIDDLVQETVIIMSPKLTPFEKLQPEKKPAHKAAIEEFEQQESELISSMLDFAKNNQLPKITHWQDIEKGRVVEGMTELECQLALGKPRIVIDDEKEVQWQINSSMYIFFRNGKVHSVVK